MGLVSIVSKLFLVSVTVALWDWTAHHCHNKIEAILVGVTEEVPKRWRRPLRDQSKIRRNNAMLSATIGRQQSKRKLLSKCVRCIYLAPRPRPRNRRRRLGITDKFSKLSDPLIDSIDFKQSATGSKARRWYLLHDTCRILKPLFLWIFNIKWLDSYITNQD